jgi:hypothetical protein
MIELPLKNKSIRPSTMLIDVVIEDSTNRSHCQCIVISTNTITKFFCNWILTNEIIMKVVRGCFKRRKRYFPLIATHAKLDYGKSRGGKGLCLPMKSMAVRAFETHITKAMNLPRWIKGATCSREVNLNI